jgi:hypothetical protein
MMSGLDVERALPAPLCIGPMQRALDLCLITPARADSSTRRFGAFHLVQARLADI